MKSYVSLLSAHVSALVAGAEDAATSPDISMTNQSHAHRRWRDSGQATLPRLGDEREETSVGSDQRNHRHERSIGMASVDHEIRPKDSAASTKPHERNPQCKDFSLRAYSPRDRTGQMAREHSQEGIDLWRSIQRVNEESSLP